MSDVPIKADIELDARGLNCPMPILRTKKTMKELKAGQVLHLIASDAGSANDLPFFCTQSGNELIASSDEGGEYHFYIRKC